MRDPYETLGLDRDASQEDVKAAFRRLAAEHHPDRNEGDAAAEQRFKDANAAFQILGDPEKRAAWDRGERLDAGPEAEASSGVEVDPEVAAAVEFAKEFLPEVGLGLQAVWTGEPVGTVASRAYGNARRVVVAKAATPEGQAQIRAVTRAGFDLLGALIRPRAPP